MLYLLRMILDMFSLRTRQASRNNELNKKAEELKKEIKELDKPVVVEDKELKEEIEYWDKEKK